MRAENYLNQLEEFPDGSDIKYIAFRLREALESYEKDLQAERTKSYKVLEILSSPDARERGNVMNDRLKQLNNKLSILLQLCRNTSAECHLKELCEILDDIRGEQ